MRSGGTRYPRRKRISGGANKMSDNADSAGDSSSSSKPVKAEAVITADEVGRIIDLGLGRGVDATDKSPWVKKTSFQVRRVTIDNIIGTEEGGALQSYEHEISSVTTQQTDLKASVAVPQAPVNIGLEGELSRSITKTRKALGKKVLNRTISFRSDFDDLPQASNDDGSTNKARVESALSTSITYPTEETSTASQGEKGTATTSKISTLSSYPGPSHSEVKPSHDHSPLNQSRFTFEERLSKWILERALHRQEIRKKKAKQEGTKPPSEFHLEGNDPLSDINEYIDQIDEEETKEILGDCYDFVKNFRITHYVSSIQLGASQYRVLSESEYYSKVSGGGTFGYEAIANLSASQSFTKKVTKKASDVREIGKITDGMVERGSYNEAVVGIQIQPIHSLVKLRYLHLALRKALLKYIDQKGDTSAGPFVIGCGNDHIYWKVNPENGYSVEATGNVQEASLFYIIPIDDGDHPYEFNIGWQGDDYRVLRRNKSSTLLTPFVQSHHTPLFRYLDAKVSLLGTNEGPLYLKNELEAKHSRLTLNHRIVGRTSIPVDTRGWVSGKDNFFINCSRRKFKKDGFIAVKRVRGRRNRRQGVELGPEFITACVPSEKYHNEQFVWMLFRIFSPTIRDNLSAAEEEPLSPDEEKLEEETRSYFGFVSGAVGKVKKLIPAPLGGGGHTESTDTASKEAAVHFESDDQPGIQMKTLQTSQI